MRKPFGRSLALSFLLAGSLHFSASHPASAMEAEFGDFQRIMLMPLQAQVKRADAILNRKYKKDFNPATYESNMENSIPFYALASDATFAAYRIAAARPELLAGYEVYESCRGGAPRTLLECFFRGGAPGEYVDLAASCPVCSAEAITLFLWDEAGVPSSQFTGGLRFLYDPSLREPPPL
ncbi:hypothetical protein [Geomonas subterranea]|uniref:hypothetical protein n=1 Tax=Geomonas subterranea TaxID=2847989 RepID=UPI001CD574F2|nr:hypothetical protein [Geomonas fuzhouensis]